MFVINTPGIFKFLWAIVKPIINPNTLEKICILGSNYYDNLVECIPKESIPKEYGGTLEVELPKGGPFCDAKTDGTTNNPVTITVNRSDKIKVEIEIKEEGSNLAWEFSTQAFDIGFSVIKEEEDLVKYQRIDASSDKQFGALSSLSKGNYSLIFDNSFSYIRSKTLTYQIFISPPCATLLTSEEINCNIQSDDSLSKEEIPL